jgi:3-oxoacyl-[acyl-carrier-protein] synthase-3
MDIGIEGYGLYLPDRYETAAEIAARAGMTTEEVVALGIEGKCLPSQEDQPVTMAVRAALQAFERTPGIRPEEVDVVIWTGEEYKDHIAQTAAIRLQEEAGCRNAWAFDLVGQGITSILGLRVARDLMIGDNAVQTVLLAGGTRNMDLVDYRNPDTRFLLSSSASGGALLLKRGSPVNRLGKTAFLVDSEMADDVYVPGGGTEIPFSTDNLGSAQMFYQAKRPEALAVYLKKRWEAALIEVLKAVLGDERTDYLALRHAGPSVRRRILEEFHLLHNRSPSLSRWGHHGPNDVLIALDQGIRSGMLSRGMKVTLASAGLGFCYAAAVVEWGRR